ncbi:MAG: hypothetical protein COA54_13220 [Thiotrichaceae bacterium]|nr:MAG: hypothetical protein COA54_13220 [Thiotrichaceae bacterium]
MPARSELHIIAPGLCGPLAEIQSIKNHVELGKWVRSLSAAKIVSSQKSTNEVLAAIFGLNIEADFPAAAFTLLANDLYHEAKYYMYADPVHLQADMDRAVLTSAEDLNVTEFEAVSLCESLNQHFKQDGHSFLLIDNNQWIVQSNDKMQMTTTSLTEAIGRNVNFILPEGKQAMRWKQILTEAQMLMFAHEVNQSRQHRSLQTINSLWFYGVGALPVVNSGLCPVNSLCGNQTMLEGLAKHVQCEYFMRPDSVEEYINYLTDLSPASVNVLHLPELEHLVNYTDVSIWTEKLLQQLTCWIYPLIDMAHKNNIKITLYPCNAKQYHFSKYDYLRFWCRGKLEQHVHSY